MAIKRAVCKNNNSTLFLKFVRYPQPCNINSVSLRCMNIVIVEHAFTRLIVLKYGNKCLLLEKQSKCYNWCKQKGVETKFAQDALNQILNVKRTVW